MVFWRNLFGSAAVLPLILVSRGGTSWRSILLLGRWGWATIVASSFATICFLAAFAHTSVANVSIIYATAPLMTAFIAWFWLREKAPRRTICAAVLALLGVAITAAGSVDAGTLFGDGLALMMTVSMSLMTVIARRHGQLPALLTACISSLVAASAVLPLGWVSSASFVITWEAMAWLAGFGIIDHGCRIAMLSLRCRRCTRRAGHVDQRLGNAVRSALGMARLRRNPVGRIPPWRLRCGVRYPLAVGRQSLLASSSTKPSRLIGGIGHDPSWSFEISRRGILALPCKIEPGRSATKAWRQAVRRRENADG